MFLIPGAMCLTQWLEDVILAILEFHIYGYIKLSREVRKIKTCDKLRPEQDDGD